MKIEEAAFLFGLSRCVPLLTTYRAPCRSRADYSSVLPLDHDAAATTETFLRVLCPSKYYPHAFALPTLFC